MPTIDRNSEEECAAWIDAHIAAAIPPEISRDDPYFMAIKKHMIHKCAVAENGYLFVWRAKDEKDKVQFEMDYSRRIHSGSIEALCVRNSNNKTVGVCCAGD